MSHRIKNVLNRLSAVGDERNGREEEKRWSLENRWSPPPASRVAVHLGQLGRRIALQAMASSTPAPGSHRAVLDARRQYVWGTLMLLSVVFLWVSVSCSWSLLATGNES